MKRDGEEESVCIRVFLNEWKKNRRRNNNNNNRMLLKSRMFPYLADARKQIVHTGLLLCPKWGVTAELLVSSDILFEDLGAGLDRDQVDREGKRNFRITYR